MSNRSHENILQCMHVTQAAAGEGQSRNSKRFIYFCKELGFYPEGSWG